MNLGTGSYLTQNWDEGNCLSIQLVEEPSVDSRFLISMDEDLGTTFWTKANSNIMMATEGQSVVCTDEPTGSFRYNLLPLSEEDLD